MKDTSTSSDTTREILPISELFKPTNVTPPQNREPNVPTQGTVAVPAKQ